ncbi:homoserine dehydrogenase [Sediminibacillus massiliensis]|uniref:homoserine dehydrogenase n=1 Tax=Sediminibacillus massiliensis TaxID=1926277 RepID=UPI0015C3EEBD|nr:homoserine dehydrogenase [Sediminibacillus massiliensis]
MRPIRVALLGFGTVGSSVYEIIQSHQQKLKQLTGRNIEVAGILVKDEQKRRDVADQVVITSDYQQILNIPDLDVIIEAIVGVEPGYTCLTEAIEKGLHVITANKEMLAHKGNELRDAARRHNVSLKCEASVGGGIPLIGTLTQLLQVNTMTKIEAILNGTSNYILTDILTNQTGFEQSLKAAQELGYAEADPANDVDGYDAFYKLMVLSDLLFKKQPAWNQVAVKGIRETGLKEILAADQAGLKIKHLALLETSDGGAWTSVEPVALTDSHPLYSVDGVDNAVNLNGDLVGEVKLQGPGAGAYPTASAILEDLIQIYQHKEDNIQNDAVEFKSRDKQRAEQWFVLSQQSSLAGKNVSSNWKFEGDIDGWYGYQLSATEEQIEVLKETYPETKAYRLAGLPTQSATPALVSI